VSHLPETVIRLPPNHGLHPARLPPPEIRGHSRFQGVLWRGLFPAPATRMKPDRQVISADHARHVGLTLNKVITTLAASVAPPALSQAPGRWHDDRRGLRFAHPTVLDSQAAAPAGRALSGAPTTTTWKGR